MNITKAFCLSIALLGASNMQAITNSDFVIQQDNTQINLKSRKQAVIRQDAEYDFMQEIMGGTNKNLPILLVDAVNCKEMVSSVEKAKAEIKYRGNSKVVFKVKKSEKLAPKKLPMLSTNFSDAFKYLLMRPGWIALVRGKRTLQADSFVDQWIENRHKR